MSEMIVVRSSEQSTSTRMNQNQPTNQNRPIKEKKYHNNQPNNPPAVQLANIETNYSHKINQKTYWESFPYKTIGYKHS